MAAKVFAVGDVLPAGKIKITWNITRSVKSDDDYYIEDDYPYNFEITSQEFGSWHIIINDVSFYSNIGEHIITLTESVTITRADIEISQYFYWEVIPLGYSITFEENGGTSVTDLTNITQLPSSLPTTTKANNVFAGWYLDSAFTQKAVAGATIESNVTLYAKWYTPASWFTDVTDAIREKEGSEEPIKHVDFPDRIRALNIAVELTQTQYDTLSTKDSNTYYLIVEEA